MQGRSAVLMFLTILACATVLVCCVCFFRSSSAEAVPNPEYVENSPDTVTLPYLLVHGYFPPSTAEIVMRLAVGLTSLVAAAMVASRLFASRKLLTGAAVAAASATLAFLFLCAVAGRMPRSLVYYFALAASPIVGVPAALVAARWWPNTSLERTRDG
jgi:hypothetical protein